MSRNLSLALNLAAIAVGMLLLAFASVPLYRLFCEVTGYGGTPRQSATAPASATSQTIIVTFNADHDQMLPWEFAPGQKRMKVKIGEQTLTHYVARNLENRPITGRAVYNVVPQAAGRYFSKMECFCFTEQTLAPRARVDMPVSFYIEPDILNDPELKHLTTITLSYTFFEVKN